MNEQFLTYFCNNNECYLNMLRLGWLIMLVILTPGTRCCTVDTDAAESPKFLPVLTDFSVAICFVKFKSDMQQTYI